MEFEITTVRDDSIPRRRISIDKVSSTFPLINIVGSDALYDEYDAEMFRRARDNGFALIADKSHSEYFNRRFIQNSTFLADVLETKAKIDPQENHGFEQYISLALIQAHGKRDPTAVPEPSTEGEDDALHYLYKTCRESGVSNQSPAVALMEQLIRQTPTYLGVKKPKYDIVGLGSDGGIVVHYRQMLSKGTQVITYALGYKQKRRKPGATPTQHRFP